MRVFRHKTVVLAFVVTAAGATATPSLAVRASTSGGGGNAVRASVSGGGGNAVRASVSGGGGNAVRASVSGGGGNAQSTPAATSSSDGTSAGELAAMAGAGALLVSAAGLGLARKHMRPGHLA